MSNVKSERLKEILEAACQVFSVRGFDKTKIEDITRTAGIGKSTFYEYFDSKTAVFVKLYETIFERYRNQLTAIADEETHIKEKLQSYLKLHCNSMSERYRLVFYNLHEAIRYKEMRDFAFNQYTFVHRLLLSCFEKAAAKGEIRQNTNYDCACYLVYGAVQRISLDHVFGQIKNVPEEKLNKLTDDIMAFLS